MKKRLKAPEARAAQAAFRLQAAAVPANRYIHTVKSQLSLVVAEAMLEGELCYRAGRYPVAFAALRHAVALEDALPYEYVQLGLLEPSGLDPLV